MGANLCCALEVGHLTILDGLRDRAIFLHSSGPHMLTKDESVLQLVFRPHAPAIPRATSPATSSRSSVVFEHSLPPVDPEISERRFEVARVPRDEDSQWTLVDCLRCPGRMVGCSHNAGCCQTVLTFALPSALRPN